MCMGGRGGGGFCCYCLVFFLFFFFGGEIASETEKEGKRDRESERWRSIGGGRVKRSGLVFGEGVKRVAG